MAMVNLDGVRPVRMSYVFRILCGGLSEVLVLQEKVKMVKVSKTNIQKLDVFICSYFISTRMHWVFSIPDQQIYLLPDFQGILLSLITLH